MAFVLSNLMTPSMPLDYDYDYVIKMADYYIPLAKKISPITFVAGIIGILIVIKIDESKSILEGNKWLIVIIWLTQYIIINPRANQ